MISNNQLLYHAVYSTNVVKKIIYGPGNIIQDCSLSTFINKYLIKFELIDDFKKFLLMKKKLIGRK